MYVFVCMFERTYVCMFACMYVLCMHVYLYGCMYVCKYVMGWLRWVGCLKIQVSLQNTGLFCRALLQKRSLFLSILLIVATPYHGGSMQILTMHVYIYFLCMYIDIYLRINMYTSIPTLSLYTRRRWQDVWRMPTNISVMCKYWFMYT